ncbi:putative Succinate-semialdehyde dehydrogenase [Glarea lozoyensis 74030]|uniref:Putative Succinate-semialdehyde dehydrogenase n=1 Tax=Glarea lozoyensis (strain ATCC 74030 / MF5533) TaxID=1104152 RepID=H0EPV4_GLAL7|nr:putative Succinate-semialdehyde dehydrogenase [Glarea lozoyensis 74030]
MENGNSLTNGHSNTNQLSELADKSLFISDSFVDGAWISTERQFDVFNPATDEKISSVASLDRDDFIKAIKSAHVAQKKYYKSTTAPARGALLRRWYELIMENKRDLATILCLENGKTFAEAEGEVVWNFPAAMITRKVAPALAAGCSVVIKPPNVQDKPASPYPNTPPSANRLLVQKTILPKFTAALVAKVNALTVGSGFDTTVTQGPLVNKSAVAKIHEHVTDAIARGATLETGGKPLDRPGCFFAPTVLSGVTTSMLVASEETFGPLAPIFAFETEEEAVQLANDTEFGLAGYLFSRDASRCVRDPVWGG